MLGARWGALVFLLDVAKGWLAAFLPLAIHRTLGIPASPAALLTGMVAGGIAAILGHVFSPWVRFRGGRGVASSLGVFLAIAPMPTVIVLACWVALVASSRRVSVGSIGAALIYPFLVLVLMRDHPYRVALVLVSGAVALLVILRHKANIGRLLAGTEPPIMGRKAGGAR